MRSGRRRRISICGGGCGNCFGYIKSQGVIERHYSEEGIDCLRELESAPDNGDLNLRGHTSLHSTIIHFS